MKALPLVAAAALAFTTIAPLSSPAASDQVRSPAQAAAAEVFPESTAPLAVPLPRVAAD